jgi:predicted SprT family Zn-dependent metalloprotease
MPALKVPNPEIRLLSPRDTRSPRQPPQINIPTTNPTRKISFWRAFLRDQLRAYDPSTNAPTVVANMARLRKPTLNEPNISMPPSAARATRSSPRKAARSTNYATSSSDENDEPRTSVRASRYTTPSILVPKAAPALDALTPRKQRVLRAVESNSRLLRKLSDESLASPEKKQRERRVRSGTTDTDVGKKTSLLYARTLAKSVVRKQASRAKIDVLGKEDVRESGRNVVREEDKVGDALREEVEVEVEAEEDAETSLWCGDEEDGEDAAVEEKEETPVVETSEDEEEDPVVDARQRRQRAQTRRKESESESESESGSQDEFEDAMPELEPEMPEPTEHEPQPLRSMRPPHKKGHSTISNWAQEVIDLTDSPEAPTSFVLPSLPPPSRTRTSSFASSRPQTSSSNGGGHALLTYSPTPTKLRSPCKAPPMARPTTPPLAPPSPSKLVSPSKKKPTIPKAPNLRPSLDAFWDPEVVNDWNEQHSPSKPLVSPKKQKWRDDIVKMMEGVALEDGASDSDAEPPSPSTSPRKQKPTQPRSPVKKPTLPTPSSDSTTKALRAQRKAFSTKKHALATSFLTLLDTTICAGRIASLTSSTGGIKLVWSRTLKTTAGRANWRRETLRLRTGPQASDFSTETRHHCSIDLAEKVIDDEERLYNVLAHEFCHLTTFMLSNVRNNPHGAEFKAWGRAASAAFAHLGVAVTTKHAYAIEYKFVWECVACGCAFKRHSKSVDVARHSCGKCKGRLVQIKPPPREKKDPGAYQVFVKENFARVKADLLGRGEEAKMARVVEVVAREYRESRAGKGAHGLGLEEALEALEI